ncbi:hypothetical protein BGW38_008882 [Lunasporangiospora selenospora]|uniref:EF-hand domain-containing protein n=1 Tax=Lunasporangiospora selenospora TaxID=979761 RepID=A0A9P6FXY9_9FUNG|nr:hypothetical protein BGW38_008882 [Lunasporangiospora selenospora]
MATIDLTKAETLFKTFDKNGDQKIDIDELKSLLTELGESFSNDSLAQYFAEVDTNGDGALSLDEFLVVVKSLHAKRIL